MEKNTSYRYAMEDNLQREAIARFPNYLHKKFSREIGSFKDFCIIFKPPIIAIDATYPTPLV